MLKAIAKLVFVFALFVTVGFAANITNVPDASAGPYEEIREGITYEEIDEWDTDDWEIIRGPGLNRFGSVDSADSADSVDTVDANVGSVGNADSVGVADSAD